MSKVKQMPTAFKILSDGLKKVAKESIKSDASTIATKLNMTPHGVRPYLKGNVADFETGQKVLSELNNLIAQRERSAKKLVA